MRTVGLTDRTSRCFHATVGMSALGQKRTLRSFARTQFDSKRALLIYLNTHGD
jgi:hypothetical protein